MSDFNNITDQQIAEFIKIATSTPKALLEQFISLGNIYKIFINSPDKSNQNRINYINRAYNSLNIINKLIALASNGEDAASQATSSSPFGKEIKPYDGEQVDVSKVNNIRNVLNGVDPAKEEEKRRRALLEEQQAIEKKRQEYEERRQKRREKRERRRAIEEQARIEREKLALENTAKENTNNNLDKMDVDDFLNNNNEDNDIVLVKRTYKIPKRNNNVKESSSEKSKASISNSSKKTTKKKTTTKDNSISTSADKLLSSKDNNVTTETKTSNKSSNTISKKSSVSKNTTNAKSTNTSTKSGSTKTNNASKSSTSKASSSNTKKKTTPTIDKVKLLQEDLKLIGVSDKSVQYSIISNIGTLAKDSKSDKYNDIIESIANSTNKIKSTISGNFTKTLNNVNYSKAKNLKLNSKTTKEQFIEAVYKFTKEE